MLSARADITRRAMKCRNQVAEPQGLNRNFSSRSVRQMKLVRQLIRNNIVALIIAGAAILLSPAGRAQDQSQTPSASSAQESGTSTDLFVMLGSDLDRPGWVPAANYNIGIGHTFGFLKKDPFGDEVTL